MFKKSPHLLKKYEADAKARVKVGPDNLPSVLFGTIFNAHGDLTCIDVSSDLRCIAAGMEDSIIKVWYPMEQNNDGPSKTFHKAETKSPPPPPPPPPAETGEEEGSNESHLLTPPIVTSLANEGETRRHDDNADTWNAVPRECELLIGHSGPVYAVSFCPVIDSMKEMYEEAENLNPSSHRKRKRVGMQRYFGGPSYLLSSSSDCTIRLWNLHTLSNIAIYKGHIGPVWCVRFSQYGHFFASGSGDRTVRIWSTSSISPLRVCAGHSSDVDAVTMHPNCNLVASGSSDKTVRLWDVQKAICVRQFFGHLGPVLDVAFSPDGRFLASSAEDTVVNLWDIKVCMYVCAF